MITIVMTIGMRPAILNTQRGAYEMQRIEESIKGVQEEVARNILSKEVKNRPESLLIGNV